MTETLPMFDLPAVPALPRPKRKQVGKGAIKYEAYSVRKPPLCADCAQALYEALMANGPTFTARLARFKRQQGGVTTFLCGEHKQDRELEELNPTQEGEASEQPERDQ